MGIFKTPEADGMYLTGSVFDLSQIIGFVIVQGKKDSLDRTHRIYKNRDIIVIGQMAMSNGIRNGLDGDHRRFSDDDDTHQTSLPSFPRR